MRRKEAKNCLFMCFAYFGVLMLLSAWLSIDCYCYDAEYYWEIGRKAVEDGVFRLSNYPQTFRGCYLPIIIVFLRHLLGDVCWAWRIFINLLVSIEFAIILPMVFDDALIGKRKIIRSSISLSIFIWLWGNYLQYPLSDFVAFFCFTAAVVLMKKAAHREKVLYIIFEGTACGAFLYLAYNTRVIFLWGGLVLILSAALYLLKSNGIKRLMLIMLAVGIAIVITALPQMIVNQNKEGVASPRVYTENLDNDTKLEYQQIFWGIKYPRYETTLNFEVWGKPQMFWMDSAGAELINRRNINEDTFKLKQYLGLWLRNPVDMVAIYTRHFVSASTPIFMQVLVTDLHKDRTAILAAIITLWFISGVAVIENIKHRKVHGAVWIIPIVLPSLMQMLGAVEIRFFLPIYVLLIYYVCTVVDYRDLNNKTKNKRLELIVAYAVVFLLWNALYSDLLAMNCDAVFLINE